MHHAILCISLPSLHRYDTKRPNFASPRLWNRWTQPKNCRFLFLNLDNDRYGREENFAKICQIKWNWIRSVKFEIVRVDFKWLIGLLSSKNFATIATWRNDLSSLLSVRFRSIALALPLENFAGDVRNPGFWYLEYSSRIQNPTNDWNWEPVPGIRNPLCGIQNPRLLDFLSRGELVNITSCVEDAGFFRGKRKFSRTRARPREEKGLLFLFVCFPLHELHNKLTQLTSACHVLYEIEFYMNQRNFEFCQLLLFFYYSLNIFIYSFFYLRTSEGHGCSCKGWLSTLQEGGGGMGRLWWGMNGIHQNRPFFKMA